MSYHTGTCSSCSEVLSEDDIGFLCEACGGVAHVRDCYCFEKRICKLCDDNDVGKVLLKLINLNEEEDAGRRHLREKARLRLLTVPYEGKYWQSTFIEYDGNCLFSSMSYSLLGSSDHQRSLRMKLVFDVANKLIAGDKNWSTGVAHEHFSDVADGFMELSPKGKARAYIEMMSRDGLWGGSPEMDLAIGLFK